MCIHICMYTYTHIQMYMYTYIHIPTCSYIHMIISHICIYTHTAHMSAYIHSSPLAAFVFSISTGWVLLKTGHRTTCAVSTLCRLIPELAHQGPRVLEREEGGADLVV